MRWEIVSASMAEMMCKWIRSERTIALAARGGDVRRVLALIITQSGTDRLPPIIGLVPSARKGTHSSYPLSQFQLHTTASTHIHNGRKLSEEGAPRSHEYRRQQSMRRLQRPLASMGIRQLRHLYLSRMLRRAQRIRCTHLLRKEYHHGQMVRRAVEQDEGMYHGFGLLSDH